MKVLIIEDDKSIAKQLSGRLVDVGYVTKICDNGTDGLHFGLVEQFDAVLLDLGLPEMDGISILEQWRAADRNMPVIIVTARTEKIQTVRGLEAGADDYIYKPFDLDEVAARVRANIRRHKGEHKPVKSYADVKFDTRTGRITKKEEFIKLTRLEFLLVQYLFMNQGRLMSVTEISEHIYEDFDHDSSIIARHIANIRKKMGAQFIKTESNRGYLIPLE